MRAPTDRRDSTFDELVAETLLELEENPDYRLLELSEDEVLRQLADYQRWLERDGAYSVRARAVGAGVWTYWHEHRRGRR